MAVQNTKRHRTRLGNINKDVEEKTAHIDFKMVTFSLGGKDYGVDIMKVKEIAKYQAFTYVPNAPRFVEGVYNLRGDIISIIDLRKMFNLQVEEGGETSKNGLILRLDHNLLGIIVDKIDKVVGISSESIQPPHPIFGDINIKFISGVVEHESRLYIILDVDKIFQKDEEVKTNSKDVNRKEQPRQTENSQAIHSAPAASDKRSSENHEELDKSFIYETLQTFAGFYVTPLNKSWIDKRFADWREERNSIQQSVQLESEDDAQSFLKGFYSPFTGQLWGDGYSDQVKRLLPQNIGKTITVWNPGCGKGLETFSLACLLKTTFPDCQLKIWAVDKDLMAISSAPTLTFAVESVPELMKGFLVEGSKGYSFSSEIVDSILFEYSDVSNGSTVPNCDIIMARDILSLLPQNQQQALLAGFHEKLKSGGVLLLGKNEYPADAGWKFTGKDAVSAALKQ